VKKAVINDAVRRTVAAAFANCCAYCRSAQEYIPDILEIEHIQPRCHGGTNDKNNLCVACGECNRHKSSRTTAIDPQTRRRVALFHPRKQRWNDHFRWSKSGFEIVGLTVCGRATIEALALNSELWQTVRMNWVTAGWHPEVDPNCWTGFGVG
jgi:hypothetical protein